MRIKQEFMKKPYQHPVMQVLPIHRAVPMLAASPFQELESSPGDVDPNTQIDTGLARELGLDDYAF